MHYIGKLNNVCEVMMAGGYSVPFLIGFSYNSMFRESQFSELYSFFFYAVLYIIL